MPMTRSLGLLERLRDGEVLILDGAIGTELQRRGVPMDSTAWCALASKSHPELLRQIHIDYIDAGADIITTNTFPTARHVLEPAGLDEETERTAPTLRGHSLQSQIECARRLPWQARKLWAFRGKVGPMLSSRRIRRHCPGTGSSASQGRSGRKCGSLVLDVTGRRILTSRSVCTTARHSARGVGIPMLTCCRAGMNRWMQCLGLVELHRLAPIGRWLSTVWSPELCEHVLESRTGSTRRRSCFGSAPWMGRINPLVFEWLVGHATISDGWPARLWRNNDWWIVS